MASNVTQTNEEWTQIISEAQQYIEQAKKADDPLLSSSKSQDAEGRITGADLARSIDHTLLKLDATPEQITELCKEAKQYNFVTVCVRQNYVAQAIHDLRQGQSNTTKVACVIGFHEGTQSTSSKVTESKSAIASGALELDLVLNRDHLFAKSYTNIYEELISIREVAPDPVLLKLIFETSRLNEGQIIAACVLAAYASFDFVKTSTGFEGRGASIEDVGLMSAMCKYMYLQAGPASAQGEGDRGRRKKMEVKASGGIRSYADAVKMIDAGATRLGTSGGVKIMEEATRSSGKQNDGDGNKESSAGNDAAY